MRLNEAKKPSSVNLKTNARQVKNRYFSGDIYDFSSDMEERTDVYVDHEGNGYITDKHGRVYPVSAHQTQGDAGRIAGGSRHYYVTIYFPGVLSANGKECFYSVEGWDAVFSHSHNSNCILDIQEGYYLEDYIAKYGKANNNLPAEVYDQLVAAAEPNAVSYSDQRRAKAKERNEIRAVQNAQKYDTKLWQNGETCYPVFEIKIENGDWVPAFSRFSNTEEKSFVPDYIAPYVHELGINRPLTDLEGLVVRIELWPEGSVDNTDCIALNIQSEKLVRIEKKENKYGGISYKEDDAIRVQYRIQHFFDTPFGKALQRNGFRKKEDVINSSFVFNADPTPYIGLSTFQEILKDWPETVKELNAKARRNAKFNTKGRSFAAVQNNRAVAIKMDAWHAGERKQNIKACSDEKLVAYYEYCSSKGYEAEANQLETEMRNRNLID